MDTLFGALTIRPALPEEVGHLIEASTALLDSFYPQEANHFVPATSLTGEHGMLLGAFLGDQAVGMVGLLRHLESNTGEIKRLFVDAGNRGAGIGTALMDTIEATALAWELSAIQLETGTGQPESISLYQRLGYEFIGPFARYVENTFSVFMEKKLI
jgi:putative acetyltransferase